MGMALAHNVDLTANTTTAQHTPGTRYYDVANKKEYIYVLVNSSSAAVADGTALVQLSATPGSVTTVYSAGNAALPAGFGRGTIAAGSYGWIQTWGSCYTATKTYADSTSLIGSGDFIKPSGSDGTCVGVSLAGIANNKMGRALAAATGLASTVSLDVCCGNYWPA